ncbi:MAG: LacI family transcriptional regulator [Candidatus Hydrogenedentes bacterium]|nr:LacI family transcriptional regulator [Candidatus Hydrogenedentota bacterium]
MISNPENGKKHWTIHDIARQAGVSAKTVSRVVNRESGVGEATRAKVARIIEKVGYHPHTGARSMRSRPRDCIGVTISTPMNSVPITLDLFNFTFAELYQMFGSQGHHISFDLNPFSDNPRADYARSLWEQRCGGLVIIGPLTENDIIVPRVHASGHPYVVQSRLDSLPECSHATVDYEEGAFISTRYLTQRGHRHIGMLKGFHGFNSGLERLRGYRRALEEADMHFDTSLVHPVGFGSRDIVAAVHRLLLDPAVTAVIDCSAAEDAASIREGARRAGRVTGKDFEVVAWTYTDNAAILAEAAAHVWLPVIEAAREGFKAFAKWYSGECNEPVHVLYRPTLYETSSLPVVPKPQRLFDILT